MMHLFMFFNVSTVEDARTLINYRIMFHVEIWMIIINLLHTLFFLRVTLNIKQYHRNWTNIQAFLYIQYSLHGLTWLAQRLIIICRLTEDNVELDNCLALITSLIRTTCIFCSFYILLILTIERVFATFFLESYETVRKQILSFSLIILLVVLSVLSALFVHYFNGVFSNMLIFLVILINITAAWLNNVIYEVNRKFNQTAQTHNKYSLGRRYQISENLKNWKMIRIPILTIAILNSILAAAMCISKIFTTNFTVIIIDFIILMYTFIIPQITMRCSPLWRKEVQRSKQRLFSTSKVFSEPAEIQRPRIEVCNVFGKRLRTTQDVSEHFDNLQKMWEDNKF
ncbi:unnamed protein product [Caenorhabditis angaria]|uniref:Uncharacterized protein n=1 Tax=Caenorhabditis angaria TaxID=860376 RepID=A0A9P1N7N4_9PELO|nr:unnamed protein product [Caenorhabditis angaria]